MRVGIVALQHESNTFLSTPTTLAEFKLGTLARGRAIRDVPALGHHETSGFLETLDAAGVEAVPLVVAWAVPGGMITRDTATALIEMLWEELAVAGPLDGILAAPHGAGVSELDRDFDGLWLTLLREKVGPTMPIICTLDPHGNLSPRMIAACNATISYRTNPHLDQKARGIEAAKLMVRTLKEEVRPTQAAAFPPVAINIERQFTAGEPCLSLYAQADAILKQPKVLSNSIMLGFPYADVCEMGSAFVVVTDNDPAGAQRYADQLGRYLIDHRDRFVGQFISVDDAVDQALAAHGPVLLLDMGDNVGGGSSADGTYIAHALEQRNAGMGKLSFICLHDVEAVQQATRAGVGSRLELAMGGKTDDQHGTPLRTQVRVVSLHEGVFEETQPRHGGLTRYNMGPTAIVQSDSGLTIQLTTHRIAPFSLQQLISCDIDPTRYQVLVAKGVQAPIAAYGPVSKHIIRVNTPGSTCADMLQLAYEHRRRPLFPFEQIA